jgi:hypothetical protein
MVNAVSDEQLGILARLQNNIFCRVCEGVLPIDRALDCLQSLIGETSDAARQGMQRLIDCDTSPWCPDGWSVVEHCKGGQIEFDPAKVELYLSTGQHGEKTVEGKKLRREIKFKFKSVLNACVLDHLLANPHLIPESWKVDEQGRTRFIYFWGTVYRDSDRSPCVRCLYWDGGRWAWRYGWLGYHWSDLCPAAVSRWEAAKVS